MDVVAVVVVRGVEAEVVDSGAEGEVAGFKRIF